MNNDSMQIVSRTSQKRKRMASTRQEHHDQKLHTAKHQDAMFEFSKIQHHRSSSSSGGGVSRTHNGSTNTMTTCPLSSSNFTVDSTVTVTNIISSGGDNAGISGMGSFELRRDNGSIVMPCYNGLGLTRIDSGNSGSVKSDNSGSAHSNRGGNGLAKSSNRNHHLLSRNNGIDGSTPNASTSTSSNYGGSGGLVRSNHLLRRGGNDDKDRSAVGSSGSNGGGDFLARSNHLLRKGGNNENISDESARSVGLGDRYNQRSRNDNNNSNSSGLPSLSEATEYFTESSSDRNSDGQQPSTTMASSLDKSFVSAGASWPAESPDPLSATARSCATTADASEALASTTTNSSPSTSPLRTRLNAISLGVGGPLSSSSSQHLAQQAQQQMPRMYLPVRSKNRKTAAAATAGNALIARPKKKKNNATAITTTSVNNLSVSSFPSLRMSRPRVPSFEAPIAPLSATIVFVDLEGYSKSSDVHQRRLTCDFMGSVRNLLTFAYGEIPVRGNIDNYVILPTGDGAAVIVIRPPRRTMGNDDEGIDEGSHGCVHGKTADLPRQQQQQQQLPFGITCPHCSTRSLRTTEETALWIGSSLLLWASHRRIGLRVGLNSGELSIVEDPYGDPNVCGDAINMAARIMDTALPGQILVSSSTVVPNLNVLAAEDLATADLIDVREKEDDGSGANGGNNGNAAPNDGCNDCILETRNKSMECTHCPQIQYKISAEASEVVVKHGITSNVQSVCCSLHPLPRPEDLPPEFRPGAGGPPRRMIRTCHSLQHSLTRPNPKQQSFASLSSFAANAGSQNSLEKNKGGGPSSGKCGYSAPARNASWKLDNSGNLGDMGLGSHRLSMLSQLSTEDSVNSNTSRGSKTLNASITGQQHNLQQQHHQVLAILPQHVGNHHKPSTKWYMKIKPTEMQSRSNNQIKPKVLPQELIRRHKRIAFLGIIHDNLARGFIKILQKDPSHRWDEVYIFFPSDACLRDHLAANYPDKSVETLIRNKQECRSTLLDLLSPVVEDLRFLQYDQLMHCGSYWDWKDPGGFIHISPLTWGANPKTCPAMNYYWNSKVPSPEYRIYKEGMEFLLGTAAPFKEGQGG